MRQQAFSAPVTSLAAATTGTGVAVPVNHCINTTHVIKFSAGTGAGTIVVESADTAGYSGTWTLETTLAWAAANSELNFKLDKRVGAVRHRVTVNVTGGTVDTSVQGEI